MRKNILFTAVVLPALLILASSRLPDINTRGLGEITQSTQIKIDNYYAKEETEYVTGNITEYKEDDADEDITKSNDEDKSSEDKSSEDNTDFEDDTKEDNNDEKKDNKKNKGKDEEFDEVLDEEIDEEIDEEDEEETELIDEDEEEDLEDEDLEDEDEDDEEGELTFELIDEDEFSDETDPSLINGRLNGDPLIDKSDFPTDDLDEEYDINGTTYNKTFATVSDMVKSTTCKNGYLVKVKGYYADGDGGGADYKISNTKGAVSYKLSNGLYANLEYSDSISVKKLGAVGDGKKDDSEYFKKAFTLDVKKVTVATGTYNLNYKEIKIPRGVSIEGAGAQNSILTNLNFSAHNGLTLKNLACKGAASFNNVWNTLEPQDKRIMFRTTPTGDETFELTNCSFSDTDIVSFALGTEKSTGYFKYDKVSGCTFNNIGECAIYHGINILNSSYVNNTFTNIGSKSTSHGQLAAIWLGDCSNCYNFESYNVEILNNTFTNLYTANEFDPNVKHVIMANFITVRADTAVINGNTIKNLVGYGNDREAVYTKVRDLTIKNNYIENGGAGEAYICNKGQDGNIRTLIQGNTIKGDYGCGIRTYGTAKIFENKITISHCTAAIFTSQRDGQVGDWPVEIVRNEIKAGAGKAYTVSNHSINDYSSGNLIKVIRPTNTCKINDNIINPQSDYSSFISVANAKRSIYVRNNVINMTGYKGQAIFLYDKKDSSVVSSQEIVISGNTINADQGLKYIGINLETTKTTRKISYLENTFKLKSNGKKSYVLSCTSSTGSKDSLTISGNSSNVSNTNTFITTNVKKVSFSDTDFAKLMQK